MTVTNAAPDDFLSEYIRCTNTHQFDAVSPFISDDAVYWFSNGSYRGLSAIQAAFERTWAAIQDEVYVVENVEWLAVDEAGASCIYAYRWRGIIEGVAREGSGRGTNILRRDSRQWRIVHEHLSPRP